VGFDDIELAALIGLTTVRQPLEQSGVESARRLSALLRGEQVRPLRQVLDVRLVRRETTAPPWSAGQASSGRGAVREAAAAAERHYHTDAWRSWRAGRLAGVPHAGRAGLGNSS